MNYPLTACLSAPGLLNRLDGCSICGLSVSLNNVAANVEVTSCLFFFLPCEPAFVHCDPSVAFKER